MSINTYSYTSKGSRDNNEDYCGFEVKDNSGVWVLADGLGGHDCGEIASKIATEFILEVYKKVPDYSADSLIAIMNETNKKIIAEQNNNALAKEMRTTIVAAFAKGNTFSYFNVGDSRVFYFKYGCLYTHS